MQMNGKKLQCIFLNFWQFGYLYSLVHFIIFMMPLFCAEKQMAFLQ